MNTNATNEPKGSGGPKTIITVRMPAEAAQRLEQDLPRVNVELAKAGLPTIESIRRLDTPEIPENAS